MQFNINNGPIYDPQAVQPMRDELIAAGIQEMLSPADVERFIEGNKDKTVLVMINSVCGCAAGSARPGLTLALQNEVIPDVLTTTFAGQDREAVSYLREKYLSDFPPSSPFIAIFKNGKYVHVMQRYDIEGKSAIEVAQELVDAFNTYCSAKGPSVTREQFDAIRSAVACGSKIPLYKGN